MGQTVTQAFVWGSTKPISFIYEPIRADEQVTGNKSGRFAGVTRRSDAVHPAGADERRGSAGATDDGTRQHPRNLPLGRAGGHQQPHELLGLPRAALRRRPHLHRLHVGLGRA